MSGSTTTGLITKGEALLDRIEKFNLAEKDDIVESNMPNLDELIASLENAPPVAHEHGTSIDPRVGDLLVRARRLRNSHYGTQAKQAPNGETGSARRRRISAFAPLTCFAFGLAAWSAAAGLAWLTWDHFGWKETPGFVVESEVENGSTQPEASFTYRYELDGHTYSSRRKLGRFVSRMDAARAVKEYVKGESLKVYYNPDGPEESTLDRAFGSGIVLPAILGCALIGLGVAMMVERRKYLRSAQGH